MLVYFWGTIRAKGFVIQFCYPVATFGTADLKSSKGGDYYRGDLQYLGELQVFIQRKWELQRQEQLQRQGELQRVTKRLRVTKTTRVTVFIQRHWISEKLTFVYYLRKT